MNRYILIALVISVLSCACTNSKKDIEWTIESTKTIKHAETDGKKIQIVYSAAISGPLTLIDTSIVVRIYRDTLLLEEIEYNIIKGDTIKWRHHINEFNAKGMVLKEIDSVNATLRSQRLNFYEDGKLQRTEILTINHDDTMQLAGADTVRSTLISVFNEMGKCTKVISLSKDELSSGLTGMNKYDTSITHKQFNDRFWETGWFTITEGDTTSASKIQYDARGRKIAIAEMSHKSGLATFEFEYDERGNRISELVTFDEIVELTLTEYDNLNRPVIRKTLKPKNY